MSKNQKNHHKWDTFFGPDPLEGRINDLTVTPYDKPHFTGPICNQNMMQTYQEARGLIAKWGGGKSMEMTEITEYMKKSYTSPAKLTKKLSLDESILEKKSTFAAVVASNSIGKSLPYCTFCEFNREGFAVYSTHTTNNCLILQKYVCPICGTKGHTISHCKLNTTGSSIVTTMRRTDEMSRLYDQNFPSTFSKQQ